MTRLQKALYAKWISRLGRTKIKDLVDGLEAGRSIAAKSEALVEARTENELRGILLEGFGGFFHQAVYLRKPTDPEATAAAIAGIGLQAGPVAIETLAETTRGELRCLLMVEKEMEFIPVTPGPIVASPIQFPVALTVTDKTMVIQVLTMQIKAETWGEIIGTPIRKILTTVQQDGLYDQALGFLERSGVGVGAYIDYSRSASRILKRRDINTFSGTLEIGAAGSTKHNTVRGKGRRPLRESMPDKFEELVNARRIPHAEIELGADYAGLDAASRIVLYPTVGKMTFRSNLKGCDPDDFVKIVAG